MKFLIRALLACVFAAHPRVDAQSVPALINYQGQVQNPNGTTPPTADYELSFRIYDAAQGGTLIWGPQVFDGTSGPGKGPKIPVVQGYFNVMLGQLDTAGRSILPAFNNSTRFLEIKVGTNVPIVPRQQLLSAPFAMRAEGAAQADNSTKLVGFDWSAILAGGVSNPAVGKIAGTKIEDGGITTLQLAGGAVTGAKLGVNAVSSANIVNGAIQSEDLANGSVDTVRLASSSVTAQKLAMNSVGAAHLQDTSVRREKLEDGSVTLLKQAARIIVTNSPAGVGGVAVSLGCGDVTITAQSDISVVNLAVTITTTGRPVFVGLMADNPSNVSYVRSYDNNSAGAGLVISIKRSGTTICQPYLRGGFTGSTAANVQFPSSSVYHLDFPTAGTYTYEIFGRVESSDAAGIYNCRLVAYEL